MTIVAAALSSSCTGMIDAQPLPDTTGPDASPEPDVSPAPSADAAPGTPDSWSAPDATVAVSCNDPASASGDGKHYPGQPCFPCHSAGGGGPRFTLGGTLYQDDTGLSPLIGAVITVVDATDAELALVTAINGNFYTNAAIAYPVQVSASSGACTDTITMSGAPAAPGNCNAGGCHSAGNRLHLP